MGYFSWKTMDQGKSISNQHSSRGALPVVLLMPEEFGGENLVEKNYEGYGVFAGYDAYALLARMNVSEECTGDENHDREIGIKISHTNEIFEQLEYPLRFVSLGYYNKTKCAYEDFEGFSLNCESQGFFY